MWSAGCIMAELLLNHPLLPGPNEPDQLKLIWRLCGTPDRNEWHNAKVGLFSFFYVLFFLFPFGLISQKNYFILLPQDLPLYNTLKPTKSTPRELKAKLGNVQITDRKHWFSPAALDLLDKLLTLDPDQRINAGEALDSDYFWTDPMPTPKEKLPPYPPCYEWTKKKLQRKDKAEEAATKKAKLE